jgi:electron-transferring-flavoprotein dehydrogenase
MHGDPSSGSADAPPIPRAELEVDIVCAGFGPATGGFLTTLARALVHEDGTPRLESRVAPGLPLQVVCFERADDLAAAVSGAVTRARGIRASLPDVEQAGIPLMARVSQEELVYLLDPVGASRRSRPLRMLDRVLGATGRLAGVSHHAVRLPFVPPFLAKHDGLVMSLGQFCAWVASQVTATGAVQVWPASPVAEPLVASDGPPRVTGVRLVDQGVDLRGEPTVGYTQGMNVPAAPTVVDPGPVGSVGRALDARFPRAARGDDADEWALGMKCVVDLREDVALEPGTVVHTFGYPQPGIFGFLYVLTPGTVSLGIFVPSWLEACARTSYRYLQHWMLHPYLWRWLEGGTLRSWGAKSVMESGRRAEPQLVGDGFARIGEGSGSTNPLTGSGVDEAWTTGALLAEAVIELAERGEPFTGENLDRTYVARRRASWIERQLRTAEGARDGFTRGVLWGMTGMALAGLTGGRVRVPGRQRNGGPGETAHEETLARDGWPSIPYDGRLLVTHQDALLMGGKVQAAPGYADHVRFADPVLCDPCRTKLCVAMCSGQAITPAPEGGLAFDREKCVHCGACLWNCPEGNVRFTAGVGGLHSAEN